MISIDELLGKTVIGAAGNYIGEVKNLDIESKTWQVTHLHVKLSGRAAKQFGMKKTLKNCNLRLPTSAINDVGVIITLNQTLIDLVKTLNPIDC